MPSERPFARRGDCGEKRQRSSSPLAQFGMAGARRERSVRRHRQGCRPAVL